MHVTSGRISTKCKPQRVRPALRNPLGKILLLTLLRLDNLPLVQIPFMKLLVQRFERQPLYDVHGIDHVPERLAHFPSVRVAYHGVAEDLVEWDFAGEFDAEHYHTRDPEEEDVPSRFEKARRVEIIQVGCLSEETKSIN